MDDLLSEFVTECLENLTVLDQDLVRLEQNPDDRALLASVFRKVHTIKGTCGFLDLPRLETVAHAAESVLGKLRDGETAASPAVVTVVLRALDRIKQILDGLAATQAEPSGDDTALLAAIQAITATSVSPTDRPPGGIVDPGEAAMAASEVEPSGDIQGGGGAATLAARTLRVPVDLLAQMMTLVDELALTRNQLLQASRHARDAALLTPLQRLDRVTDALQAAVTKTRMQAIGVAWSRLPRLVRDLAIGVGKEIEFTMSGAETEFDRQVLEMIKDPLTHMVRNAADHGLETVDERRRLGKPARGRISLDARREGGHIVIEISDDGKGLDMARIAETAVARGLAAEAEIATMAERDIQRFILQPGFSTAETVTAVSGRGVGMDVVRTNVEKIGGSLGIRSTEGRGSTFTIEIPLTLTIVSALILDAGGESFALPQGGVVELIRAGDRSESRIKTIDGKQALRWRDRLLPLASLAVSLGLAPRVADAHGDVVLVGAGAQVFGLEVDRVIASEEIVVRPLAPTLVGVAAFSGDTILGDGRVARILDRNGLVAMLDAGPGKANHRDELDDGALQDAHASRLPFAAGNGRKIATPSPRVNRREAIEAARIGQGAGRRVG